MENVSGQQPKKDLKQAYRTSYLIAGFIQQTLTEEEREELDDWIMASDDNMRLFGKLTNEKNIAESLAAFKKMKAEEEEDLINTKKRARKNIRSWQYAIAASIILIVGLIGYFNFFSKKDKREQIITATKDDILPGSEKATLTLSDGRIVILDNITHDTAINDNVKILRKSGEIVYNNNNPEKEIEYHTLTIPRKGQYKLVLPDGSKVWLNAESSIKYPTAFAGNERKVIVTGETFFEIAKDKSKPFRAVADDMTVEALGTQFNINAYINEPSVTTTLIEGSVKVSKGNIADMLKPGEQLQIANDDSKKINVEADDVTAWKNNEFKFHNSPLEVIMRQVERWYDANVLYQDKVNIHLNATIERDVPVSKLLHLLEETGQVHFKIDEKKIIVMK